MAPKQIQTTEHVPASEHGGGFPPFQRDTFASQLIWITLAFVALYLLMSRVALPRIGSIIADRKQHIEGDFAEAERLKKEDRKSTRLNSSHLGISYAVFCLTI